MSAFSVIFLDGPYYSQKISRVTKVTAWFELPSYMIWVTFISHHTFRTAFLHIKLPKQIVQGSYEVSPMLSKFRNCKKYQVFFWIMSSDWQQFEHVPLLTKTVMKLTWVTFVVPHQCEAVCLYSNRGKPSKWGMLYF